MIKGEISNLEQLSNKYRLLRAREIMDKYSLNSDVDKEGIRALDLSINEIDMLEKNSNLWKAVENSLTSNQWKKIVSQSKEIKF